MIAVPDRRLMLDYREAINPPKDFLIGSLWLYFLKIKYVYKKILLQYL